MCVCGACMRMCSFCVVFVWYLGALVATAPVSNEGNLTSSEGSQSSLQNSTLSSNGGDQGRFVLVYHFIVTLLHHD